MTVGELMDELRGYRPELMVIIKFPTSTAGDGRCDDCGGAVSMDVQFSAEPIGTGRGMVGQSKQVAILYTEARS